jgi:Na+/H+ antiporter NhaA
VLVAATVFALAWVDVNRSSYEAVWSTVIGVRIGGTGISQDLRQWINEGLMTFFFLVMAVEARRELDLGELRDRRRVSLPWAPRSGPCWCRSASTCS